MKISFFVFIGLALFSLSFSVIGEETFYEQVTSISETTQELCFGHIRQFSWQGLS